MGTPNRDPLAWGRHCAVAGAYAACYELTRNASVSHWMLTAGLRLACLLLVPRRYWPAMVVGEALPIAESSALHAHAFGVAWAWVNSIPPMLVCAPLVGWLRSRYPVVLPDGQLNISLILVATLACSLAVAGTDALALANVSMGDGSPAPAVTGRILLAWILGAYVGALTLTPVILAAKERVANLPGGRLSWRSLQRSTLARDTLWFAMPCLGLLLFVASGAGDNDTLMMCVRVGMVVPVVALTLRHGWHGAAVGGMLASVAQASTSFQLQDPGMIRAQAVLALTASTALIFGVRIARRVAAARESTRTVAPAPSSRR